MTTIMKRVLVAVAFLYILTVSYLIWNDHILEVGIDDNKTGGAMGAGQHLATFVRDSRDAVVSVEWGNDGIRKAKYDQHQQLNVKQKSTDSHRNEGVTNFDQIYSNKAEYASTNMLQQQIQREEVNPSIAIENSHENYDDRLKPSSSNEENLHSVSSPNYDPTKKSSTQTKQHSLTMAKRILRVHHELTQSSLSVRSQWESKKPLEPPIEKSFRVVEYPHVSCTNFTSTFPIDAFYNTTDSTESHEQHDPYLPWIHDVFPTHDGKLLRFVAQNRRRCHTGKQFEETMKYYEPQVALLQPVPVKRITNNSTNQTRYMLTSYEIADEDAKETRFICRFQPGGIETLSTYPFNYEYITHKKGNPHMYKTKGKESELFWLSTLLFDCPIPTELQRHIAVGDHVDSKDRALIHADIIPIRTPVRSVPLLNERHGLHLSPGFDVKAEWGVEGYLVTKVEESGRWENIPVCYPPRPSLPHRGNGDNDDIVDVRNKTLNQAMPQNFSPQKYSNHAMGDNIKNNNSDSLISQHHFPEVLRQNMEEHVRSNLTANNIFTKRPFSNTPYRLIGCTWTSLSYNARGDEDHITDIQDRLREWMVFHLMVGFDHLYIYDNTPSNNNTSSIETLIQSNANFAFAQTRVTIIPWPCTICNNNRPGNADPGERSSQYAAESSCRQRYGVFTDWMASFDVDEYIIPLSGGGNRITDFLDRVDAEEDVKVLIFPTTRAIPRINLMEEYFDDTQCPKTGVPCLKRNTNRTFLQTFNCDYMKAPKKKTRNYRAMKHIYRTDYVLHHFVHYATVTTDFARTKYESLQTGKRFCESRRCSVKERFINDVTEAVMVHAKTPLLQENIMKRPDYCNYQSRMECYIGYVCPDNTLLTKDRKPVKPQNITGTSYCNCFVNPMIDDVWVPKLEQALQR